MSKKGLFTGLLALLLVFALLGCEQVTSGTKPGSGPGTGADPNDKWTEVTSLDGLEGTWKSSMTGTIVGPDEKPIKVEQVMMMTYPASGQNEDGSKVENGVREDASFIVDGEVMDSMVKYYSKDDYESIYMRAENSSMYINQSKTRIKMEEVDTDFSFPTEDPSTPWKTVETDEDWQQYQEWCLSNFGGQLPSGDMTITFSAGAPYKETVTTILHKQ